MEAAALLPLTLLLLVSAPAPHTSALTLPSYIKPCSRNDPKLNECVFKHSAEAKEGIVKGDRTYNIPPMEPLKITEIVVNGSDGSVGLSITFKDVSFFGFKEAEIKETNFDLAKNEAVIKVFVPVGQLLGKHVVSGKILLLPISGSGDCNITLVNLDLTFTVRWELEKRDGDEYIKPVGSEIKYDMSRAHIFLDHLFGGDKTLSDNMNTFLNENWRDVVKEIGPAVAEALEAVVIQILSGITHIVPYHTIFPDKV